MACLRAIFRTLAQQHSRCLAAGSLDVAAEQTLVAAGSRIAAWWRPSGSRAFSAAPQDSGESISVTFKDEKDGTEQTVRVAIGKSLLEAAHENEIELEGACEGSLACSTCHVIVEDQDYYDRLPEPDDDENDMLDLAFGLTDTSRLGCQVVASKELDGLVVRIPGATRNMAVDGFRPKPH
ncbi:Adrenodoxin-like protein 2 [Chlorella vulgaris]